jgi:hypothetical protein
MRSPGRRLVLALFGLAACSSTAGTRAVPDGGPLADAAMDANATGARDTGAADAGDGFRDATVAGDAGAPPVAGAAVTMAGYTKGSTVMATIGPAGGTVTSSDGRLQITVPAGALAASTSIGVVTISNEAPGGMGNAFRLTPSGQTFVKPVTLTYKPAAGELATDPPHVGVAFQTAGAWKILPGLTADPAGTTFVVTTTHFTDFAYVASLMLDGSSALLAGKVGQLFVSIHDPLPGNSPDMYLPARSTGYTGPPVQWSLDGIPVPGADASHGTLLSTVNGIVNYTAPPHLPGSHAPIAVGVTLAVGTGTVTLVRNVRVLAHQYHVDLDFHVAQTCPASPTRAVACDVRSSATFDITIGDNLIVTGSNFSAEIDPPTVTGLVACPLAPPSTITTTATYQPSKTHGLLVSSVGGTFDPVRGKLEITPNGGMVTGTPAYTWVTTAAGGILSTDEVPESRTTALFPGLYFDGVDGESQSVTYPSLGQPVVQTVSATIHVVRE